MGTQIGIVEVTCHICNKRHTITVPTAAYKRWATRQAKIQDALPMLSEDERELLISDICGGCFDRLMKPGD